MTRRQAHNPSMDEAIQGSDSQDQNLLQFFLDRVEFKMDVQQAAEAHNSLRCQMQSNLGAHQSEAGRLQLTPRVSECDRAELGRMDYKVEVVGRTYSPITAIWLDQKNGTLWGGASEQGDDYGIGW